MPAPRCTPLLLSLLLLAPLGACQVQTGGDEVSEEEDSFRPDPRTLVEVSSIRIGDVSDFLVSTGTVESEAQADLVPEAPGQVVEILAEEGDEVEAGQVLAVVRNINLSAALDRAEAELARAEAELLKVEQLHAQGAVSDRDLSEARYLVRTARATRDEAAGSAGQTLITSPIAGTVSVRDVRYGEIAGGQRAFQVVDLSRLRVVVRLPERDLARLAIGLPAAISSVYDEETPVGATVTRIAPTVDPATGTVRVTLTLEPGQSVLRPGQYVSARIEVDHHRDVLVMPRRALLYEEGEPLAFRVAIEDPPPREPSEGPALTEVSLFRFGGAKDDGVEDEELPGPYRVARKVALEIGYIDEDSVEVTSGLRAGDEVVITGQAALRDGARVRYPEDPRLGDGGDEGAVDPEDAG